MTLLAVLLTCLAGMMLGLFFFFGLWLSLQRFTTVKHPGLLFSFSFMLRSVVVIAGFYLMMRLSWWYALTALLGFIIARALLTRRFGQARPDLTVNPAALGGER